jgi:hypothetical protein
VEIKLAGSESDRVPIGAASFKISVNAIMEFKSINQHWSTFGFY